MEMAKPRTLFIGILLVRVYYLYIILHIKV